MLIKTNWVNNGGGDAYHAGVSGSKVGIGTVVKVGQVVTL